MDPPPEERNNSGVKSPVTLQVSMATSSPDDSIPSTPRVPSPNFRNSTNSLNLGLEDPRHLLGVSNLRNLSVDSSSSSGSDPTNATANSGSRSNCCSPSRSPVPPSSPQGPRFKLVYEGLVHVCRLNHTRTVISKLLSSRFLRRWEGHHVILDDTFITSRHPGGFMEEPIPYRIIQDIYPVARWDSCGRFCIRVVIPDGSLLFQVSNCYMRDQWLHSLLWKKNVYRFRKLLDCCTRPEILLKELKNLVDMVLSTPLQDESVFHSALNIISDVVVKGQTWMTRSVAEEVIVTISLLLERTTPTSEICDFFCWHCRESPRSTVVLDICTPIVQRILKHNMDFGKYPQTRVFVQEYFLALNCQNRGDSIIKEFVDNMHGLGCKCPHPRVLQNLVNICVAAIYTIFESRKTEFLESTNEEERTSVETSSYIEWETKLDCFINIFILISQFDDWRSSMAEMLQPIPFHENAIACRRFMSPFKEVIRSIVHDGRCNVHQTVLGVREHKGGWYNLYSPDSGNGVCDDEGELWSFMLEKLLSCCYKRRKFLQVVAQHLGPLMLRALRNDETCQKTLCALLEFDLIEDRDFQLQTITTLQSTPSGKRHYAVLCEKQMHLRQVQQKGGPRKLVLPNKSTDADVSRLLSSGSFGDLECLSLAFTQVTSACAEELIKLSSLKYLSLWSTQFDDSGLRLLSEHLPNLQSLDLCETRVTDHGVATLTEMKSLRKLNLNSTQLHPETFECLKKTLPVLQECDVRYTEAWGF
ncbi:c-Maf-inducing protein [Trichonephila clavata]|uniref:C-Maf-inducing protein n=1 Tax=Trichonephila clavata TaxID=2740835 RepID=A0A8X6FLU8_TRICU|nr:c-Maf-inducing protein [Trichonephila clavata]